MHNFENGFVFAIMHFKAGETVEWISNRSEYDGTYFGRGMFAACETILGWQDIAEREARAHGFNREGAAALVRRGVAMLSHGEV